MAAICRLPRHRRLRALLLLQRRRNRASSRTLRSHIHVQVAVVVQAQLQHGTAGNRTFKYVVRAIRIEPVGRTFIGDLRLLVHFGYRNRLLGRSCIRLGKGGHRAIHRIALGVLRARVVQVTHRIVGIIARRPFSHKGVVRLLEHIALAVGRRIGQRVFARLFVDYLQIPARKIIACARRRGELSERGRRIRGRCGSRVSDVVHAATTSGVKGHDELVRVVLPHSVQRQIVRGHRGSRARRSRRARRHLDGVGVIVHGVLGGRPALEDVTRLGRNATSGNRDIQRSNVSSESDIGDFPNIAQSTAVGIEAHLVVAHFPLRNQVVIALDNISVVIGIAIGVFQNKRRRLVSRIDQLGR